MFLGMWHCFLVLCISAVYAQVEYRVEVTGGTIEGSAKTTNLGTTIDFLGVPYAQPPIGKLRFMPPKNPKSWDAVLETKAHGPACMQDRTWLQYVQEELQDAVPERFEEDCLTLNVYVPGDGIDAEKKLAVMVWIHGGAFAFGGSIQFPGHSLAARESVIVVTMNYRLDVLGFLSSGDELISGNMGLMDQNLALKWVQQNIAKFGGDKEQVTVFGESAGGMSASLHVVSPWSQRLFKRVIAQSGMEINKKLYEKEQLMESDSFKYFVGNLSCTKEDMAETLRCLQEARPVDILRLSKSHHQPIVDGEGGFIPEQPSDLWAKREYTPVGIMGGVMRDDGTGLFPVITGNMSYLQFYTSGMTKGEVLQYIKKLMFDVMNPSMKVDGRQLQIVLNQYFLKFDDKGENLRSVADIMTDSFFYAPTTHALHTIHQFAPRDHDGCYLYYITYKGSQNPTGTIIDMGPFHTYDTLYLTGDFVNSETPLYDLATNDDRSISRSMMRAWASFAKNG